VAAAAAADSHSRDQVPRGPQPLYDWAGASPADLRLLRQAIVHGWRGPDVIGRQIVATVIETAIGDGGTPQHRAGAMRVMSACDRDEIAAAAGVLAGME